MAARRGRVAAAAAGFASAGPVGVAVALGSVAVVTMESGGALVRMRWARPTRPLGSSAARAQAVTASSRPGNGSDPGETMVSSAPALWRSGALQVARASAEPRPHPSPEDHPDAPRRTDAG